MCGLLARGLLGQLRELHPVLEPRSVGGVAVILRQVLDTEDATERRSADRWTALRSRRRCGRTRGVADSMGSRVWLASALALSIDGQRVFTGDLLHGDAGSTDVPPR